MKLEDTMEARLMECFSKFTQIDIYGYAKLVGVDSETLKNTFKQGITENDFEEIICAAVLKFSEKNRKDRKKLLKLAYDLVEENEKIREQKAATTS